MAGVEPFKTLARWRDCGKREVESQGLRRSVDEVVESIRGLRGGTGKTPDIDVMRRQRLLQQLVADLLERDHALGVALALEMPKADLAARTFPSDLQVTAALRTTGLTDQIYKSQTQVIPDEAGEQLCKGFLESLTLSLRLFLGLFSFHRSIIGSPPERSARLQDAASSSGCPDSNRGPPPPKGGALPGCATPRLRQV